MKWTQEQQRKAGMQVELAYLARRISEGRPSERMKGVAIDLACQRNELLEALKGVLPYMEQAESAGLVGDEGCHWPVELVRAAIAKAEGQ